MPERTDGSARAAPLGPRAASWRRAFVPRWPSRPPLASASPAGLRAGSGWVDSGSGPQGGRGGAGAPRTALESVRTEDEAAPLMPPHLPAAPACEPAAWGPPSPSASGPTCSLGTRKPPLHPQTPASSQLPPAPGAEDVWSPRLGLKDVAWNPCSRRLAGAAPALPLGREHPRRGHGPAQWEPVFAGNRTADGQAPLTGTVFQTLLMRARCLRDPPVLIFSVIIIPLNRFSQWLTRTQCPFAPHPKPTLVFGPQTSAPQRLLAISSCGAFPGLTELAVPSPRYLLSPESLFLTKHTISLHTSAPNSVDALDSPSSFPPQARSPTCRRLGLPSIFLNQVSPQPTPPAHARTINLLKLLTRHMCSRHIRLRADVGHLLFSNNLRAYPSPRQPKPETRSHLQEPSSGSPAPPRLRLLPPGPQLPQPAHRPTLLLPGFPHAAPQLLEVWVG